MTRVAAERSYPDGADGEGGARVPGRSIVRIELVSDERRTLRYGSLPSQHVEAWLPAGSGPYRVAILVHGGWWRARHDHHLMDGLCADMAGMGWLAWNIEFRRIEGDAGGWPVTLDDVLDAIDHLAGSGLPIASSPPVAVGHSSGGHLALLAASRRPLAGVVALAPVTDLALSLRDGLGEGATAGFLSGAGHVRSTLESASPVHQVPLGCPQLVVHGDADVRVPVEHARRYVASARAAGDPVEYVEVEGGDHFHLIDPASGSWGRVRAWLGSQVTP